MMRSKDVKLNSTDRMVSFDVKALFTSIPQSMALEAVEGYLEKNKVICKDLGIDPAEIVSTLKVCLENTYFESRGKFFRQLKGTAMGCPSSMIVANLVMRGYDNWAANDKDITLWYRYCDDIFCICGGDKVDSILERLNAFNKDIQFTVEK
jgi:hypothetical protein